MTQARVLSLLVVDDDPVSMLVAEHILRSHGHMVSTATSVAEALDLIVAAPEPFDAVVCDYLMPDETGLDLVTSLDERGVWVPILLLTGVGDEAELGDPRSAAVAGFRTKPVQSDELIAAVNEVVGVERGAIPER